MEQKSYVAAIVVLIVFSGALFALYIQLQGSCIELNGKYNILRNAYSDLQSDYSDLNDAYDELQLDYTLLSTQYDSLQEDYDELWSEYLDLDFEYTLALENYEDLMNEYDSLWEDYEIETTLRMGSSLAQYYDALRTQYGPQRWWTRTQDMQFAANLALHSLGLIQWTSLENSFYSYVEQHSYDMAEEIMDAVINLIQVNTDHSTTERIRRILDFISRNIHYEYDFDNVYLAPPETLSFKSGDCDDFSILAAALFEAVGIDSAIGVFSYQPSGGETQYHCMVLVHLNDLGQDESGEDYDYWYYSSLTSMGLRSGRWIIIEPQYTIEDQGLDWVGQWELLAAAPIDC
ncbi:hypothetical protein KEJ18_07050 [Candidatus Bathyarchaeota archaeon]|nr:hypothetical protein [Candidatus Bathyarchaeota archaeon]